VLADAEALGVNEIRTSVSWADWYASEGDGWYAWLFERLAKQVRILPCFLHTPPSIAVVPKFSSPPEIPKSYADFIDVMITRFGQYFEWMEFWDRPDDLAQWDARLDHDWSIFCEMVGGAAYWARKRGKKTVLSGVWPTSQVWLELMHQRGVLRYIDAVGVHGFPSSPEVQWRDWHTEVGEVRSLLNRLGTDAQVWITATGFSTWRDGERAQMRAWIEAVDSTADRVYWKEAQDRAPLDERSSDEREFHYGLKRADGVPKILFRQWAAGGIPAVRQALEEPARGRSASPPKYVLITGGAGFIGTNLADRLLSAGRSVLIYDDLSRPGVERNVAWLREQHGERLRVEIADIRNRQTLRSAVRHAEQVFHFAAQVAVTTSLDDPLADFEVNVGGTLNLLEEIRVLESPPPLLFTSTNKVYGSLADLPLEQNGLRYQPLDTTLRSGVSEERRLDFHSPYGCSKGAADQYVLDYARTFGLPAVVFRMSCIYGLHQMGTEDQGWVAHFLIRALTGKPLILYGDGRQVRDLLFADDLVDAFLLAHANIHTLSGEAFNIGGGLGNTISLLELLDLIEALHGARPEVRLETWRCADQRYYVSDTRKFKAATGWSPKINARQGIEKLYHWLIEARNDAVPKTLAAGGALHAVLPH
jgi:CDP-paratose 2-epimerase